MWSRFIAVTGGAYSWDYGIFSLDFSRGVRYDLGWGGVGSELWSLRQRNDIKSKSASSKDVEPRYRISYRIYYVQYSFLWATSGGFSWWNFIFFQRRRWVGKTKTRFLSIMTWFCGIFGNWTRTLVKELVKFIKQQTEQEYGWVKNCVGFQTGCPPPPPNRAWTCTCTCTLYM